MVSVNDVADYILEKQGSMSAMKLQKLVYYSQAWHLVWHDKPLFKERIEAWTNGPVCPVLYQKHKGCFTLEPGFFDGNPELILKKSKNSIKKILDFYGPRDAQWLSELTHREAPWKDARVGIAADEIGTIEITHAAMAEYYHGLA
jgi:uncharacterized phage-associated protein